MRFRPPTVATLTTCRMPIYRHNRLPDLQQRKAALCFMEGCEHTLSNANHIRNRKLSLLVVRLSDALAALSVMEKWNSQTNSPNSPYAYFLKSRGHCPG